jgi:hypothetical protein
VFLGCFWAYVRQPHDHIGWATPMPFASINSTNPRTNPWNFHEKTLRIGGAGKWGFFESAILNFFCFISMKTSSPCIWGIIYFYTMDGFFRILEKTSSELICSRLYIYSNNRKKLQNPITLLPFIQPTNQPTLPTKPFSLSFLCMHTQIVKSRCGFLFSQKRTK